MRKWLWWVHFMERLGIYKLYIGVDPAHGKDLSAPVEIVRDRKGNLYVTRERRWWRV